MEKRQPLKRDPALVPLSREHHKGLILAQLLKADVPDYKGLPADVPGKVAYAKMEYEQWLKVHFEREEQWLVPLSQEQGQTLAKMAERVVTEHETIRTAIAQLSADVSTDTLDVLGRLLERHIRFEEREWFRGLQERGGLEG